METTTISTKYQLVLPKAIHDFARIALDRPAAGGRMAHSHPLHPLQAFRVVDLAVGIDHRIRDRERVDEEAGLRSKSGYGTG
jgi:hypothetical protein